MIDVFKVGVHIGMTTNSSQVLSMMLKELMGVHLAAGKLEGALGKIGKAALGAGAVFGGWLVIKGLIDATKHAEKLNHELTKLQIGARLSDYQKDQAQTLAFKTSRDVPGTNVADNVRMQRELYGVFGNMGEAQALMPLVAQGSRATSAFVDKDTDLARVAVRALELRGHITENGKVDPEAFKAEFNSLVRSVVASEGLLDPAKFLAFIQQAGPAARGMGSDEFWGKAPAIMNAIGASKSGTAMMSLFSQMIGHVVAGKRVAVAMESAGMLKHDSWRTGKGGKVIMDQDAVPDQGGFVDHPLTWLHEKMEALRQQKGMDEVGVIQSIFQLSSRATSARLISDLDKNWPIIQNEEARYKRMPDAPGIAKDQNDKDLSVNIHNMNEAWNNFMAALGGPGIPVAIGVLHTLTDTINAFQAGIIAHPELAKDVFELSGALASLTALGGGITVVSVALRPFASGLTAIVEVTGLAAAGASLGSVAVGLSALGAVLYGMPRLFESISKGIDGLLPDWLRTEKNIKRNGANDVPGSETTPPHHAPGGRGGSPNSSGHGHSSDNSRWVPPGALTMNNPVDVRIVNGVHVANAADIGRGMTGALANGASRPQTGPTWQDYRFDAPMPGSALA